MNRDVIVVGASAGGVEALRSMVATLPPDLPAAVLVVLHVPRESPSALPSILARSGPLPARAAVDGEPLKPGRIYVAPADHHLLVLDDHVRVSPGPTENGHRPAIDPLFRSAARAAGPRVIAVVLSGTRDDGAVGAVVVAARGGTVVVQDPEDALHPAMPLAVMARLEPDHIAPAADLGALLAGLVAEPLDRTEPASADDLLSDEVAIDAFAPLTIDRITDAPGAFGCPSCGGALIELTDQEAPRYRCRVGHAWSPQSLLDEQAVATEGALWTALRALEEKSALGRRMAGTRRSPGTGRLYTQMAEEAEQAGVLIRRLIQELAGSSATTAE
ncbi:chemotaxis protein CheB [Actinoplanes sp. NPDC026619]|uniref:chemotaxis protein CheB n=1 Tax=Actinoplanes sp. NPDC026619 TaxID=3155798 RepID=UPI0034084794